MSPGALTVGFLIFPKSTNHDKCCNDETILYHMYHFKTDSYFPVMCIIDWLIVLYVIKE